MNFLAHLYLSDPTPEAMIGNLLPDLTTGPTDPDLHPDVLAGADLHRRIDAYTDAHPCFARSADRFRPTHGRFSGILTDLFYDHVLARDWHRYHDQPLDAFIDRAHEKLITHEHRMPEPMRPIVRRMVHQGWMHRYHSLDGMAVILGMMSIRFTKRLGKTIDLTTAVDMFPMIDDELTDDFHAFFPELIAFVQARHEPPCPHKPADPMSPHPIIHIG